MRRLYRGALVAALAMACFARVSGQSGVAPGGATAAAVDTVATLAAGGGSTCVTTTRGAGWCWGSVGFGRKTAFRMREPDGRPAVLTQLVPWGWSICGLTVDGRVLCDPSLDVGLVDSAGHRRVLPPSCRDRGCLLPLAMPGEVARATAVTTGFLHACALANGGVAYCWGRNHMGQLGNGVRTLTTTPDSLAIARTPVRVLGGHRFAQLDAGELVTCGITSPGAIYCWGYGQSGETGDSTVMTYCSAPLPDPNRPCSAAQPVRVLSEPLPRERRDPSAIRFDQVSAGLRLACAIDDQGGAYCWGNNYRCALGRCRMPDSHRAHRIEMAGRVVEIGAGYWHACARTVDGRIFCWGDNVAGQLGSLASANLGSDGLPPDYRASAGERARSAAWSDDPCFNGGRCSPAPVEVSAGRQWSALAVGSDHACALARDDGAVYCWGGRDTTAFASDAPLEWCVNRSAEWKDERCHQTPIRVTGLPLLASRPLVTSVTPAPPPRPRVLVSRRELRIAFPVDTTDVRGWLESTPAASAQRYWWQLAVDGMDGPRWIWFTVARDSTSREFASFADFLHAGRAELCQGGMVVYCSDDGLRAFQRRDTLVIVFRSSTEIRRLFALRPAAVEYSVQRPEDSWDASRHSVRVEYVDPQIPLPTAATHAEWARARRRQDASINSYHRAIAGDDHWLYSGTALWLQAGDSMAVHVSEMHCTYDLCTETHPPPSDSGWSVSDSTVARLQSPDTSARRSSSWRAARYFVQALRPGRVMLAVRGVHGATDTAASSSRPERDIQRELIVTRPIARVHFVKKPDTVRVKEPFTLDLRAFDADGRELAGVPIELRYTDRGIDHGGVATPNMQIQLEAPGPTRFVARVRQFADTATVVAVDGPATPAPR
jgi:alpha-tubulin suppressor-like RCC1 family protein